MSDGLAQNDTYVLFRLGAEEYGLPVGAVVSIVRFRLPTPVPRASEFVLGVVNLRGRVLPVIDLGRRFSAEPFTAGPTSRIIVTEGENGAVGIAVDSAHEVVTFSADSVRPVPEGVLGADTVSAFVGMVERPDGLVVLLDPNETMPRLDTEITLDPYAPKEREPDV